MKYGIRVGIQLCNQRDHQSPNTLLQTAGLAPGCPQLLCFPCVSFVSTWTKACCGATTRASFCHQPTRGHHLSGCSCARRVGFPHRASTVAVRWWEGKGREGRGGRGEERERCAAQGRRRSHAAGRCPLATGATATCATPDLLLKHPDETFATYI